MKILFEDKSYVEFRKSDNPGKVIITISARDAIDPLKKISNSVELSAEDFKKLTSDV
jgi:hypothetical protein